MYPEQMTPDASDWLERRDWRARRPRRRGRRIVPAISPPVPCATPHCYADASSWLYGPGERKPVPGARCRSCADALAAEFASRKGETWPVEDARTV